MSSGFLLSAFFTSVFGRIFPTLVFSPIHGAKVEWPGVVEYGFATDVPFSKPSNIVNAFGQGCFILSVRFIPLWLNFYQSLCFTNLI